MKTAVRLGLLFVLAAIGWIQPAAAQKVIDSSLSYTWPAAVTGTSGQMGQFIVLSGTNAPRPGNYTIDVSVSGTTPSTCTFRVEGSSDASNWYGLDVTSPSTNSCTANYMESITNRPVQFIRINLTYTQGDATTKVVFHFTGGRS